MIPMRITTTRHVVSRFDPAWGHVVRSHGALDVTPYRKYCDTLDASHVLSMTDLPEAFTVFEIAPLKVRFEMFADSDRRNHWEIFRSHVISVSGVSLEKEGEILTENMHNIFTPQMIKDIADIICSIADGGGQSVFFTQPAAAGEFLDNCLRRLAREAADRQAAALALMVAAKNKDQP
jgi:hypothetical protein